METVTKYLCVLVIICTAMTECYCSETLNVMSDKAQNDTMLQQAKIAEPIKKALVCEPDIDFFSACNLVSGALNILGKNSNSVIMKKGYDIIGNDPVMVLSAGDNSVDGSKYTALYHFAVSESGNIYYMDIVKGAEWRLLMTLIFTQDRVQDFPFVGCTVIGGMYTHSGRSEIENKALTIKHLPSGLLIFELNLFSRGENMGFSGILNVDESNHAHYDSSFNDSGKYKLDFYFSAGGKEIRIVREGEMTIIPDGVYQYASGCISIKAATAIKFIESLPSVLTSLNIYNTPYTIECVDTYKYSDLCVGGFVIKAKHTESGNCIGRFLVAADLSSVYRIDDDLGEPVLIFKDRN